MDFSPIPEFAVQVYSTLPLDPDHTTLCEYLTRAIDTWPMVSFEIYGPQPDVFACVEHQRREIAHRKNTIPGDGFFPGIAKAAPTDRDRLLQGFLLVITSHSYRTGPLKSPQYEDETGPYWVNFNRSFPPKAEVDVRSRLCLVPPIGYVPSLVNEQDLYPEREEIVVKKCRNILEMCREFRYMPQRSCRDDMTFDYGINEDEGNPPLSEQPPAPEVIESLQIKANSLPHNYFTVRSLSKGAVVITSNPAVPEPDLQYIIYVAFPHTDLELTPIAQAFTAAIIDNIPHGKTINFEFHTASSLSLGAILASHRNLMNSRPGIAVGAYQPTMSTSGATPETTRVFPQGREEDWIDTHIREPYRTFFVVLDRPDFLTGPGVLFFLTDGNEITDEWKQEKQNLDPGADSAQRGDCWEYQVFRSVGMPEVARRLAMLTLEENVTAG